MRRCDDPSDDRQHQKCWTARGPALRASFRAGYLCGASSDRRTRHLMARQATGQVVIRERTRGRVYGLRFRAYGQRQYVTLGTDAEGWDRKRAGTELQNVLADVRRRTWR